MWLILFGSAVLAVTAYVALGGHPETPPPDDDETDDDEPPDETDDETDDDEPPDDETDDDDDGPNDYDNASVYFDVNAAKARKRRARVPKV